MVLDGKRFGTFVVAVGVVLLSLALWASPAWTQTNTLTVNKTASLSRSQRAKHSTTV